MPTGTRSDPSSQWGTNPLCRALRPTVLRSSSYVGTHAPDRVRVAVTRWPSLRTRGDSLARTSPVWLILRWRATAAGGAPVERCTGLPTSEPGGPFKGSVQIAPSRQPKPGVRPKPHHRWPPRRQSGPALLTRQTRCHRVAPTGRRFTTVSRTGYAGQSGALRAPVEPVTPVGRGGVRPHPEAWCRHNGHTGEWHSPPTAKLDKLPSIHEPTERPHARGREEGEGRDKVVENPALGRPLSQIGSRSQVRRRSVEHLRPRE